MKAFFATLFAVTLFSALDMTVAEPIAEKRTTGLFTCPKTCKFPPLAIPRCNILLPCYFECKNGYDAYPLLKPTKCVCNWPFTECNGKCGIQKNCSSKGIHKRDLTADTVKCPVGFSACGVYGRTTDAWECVNTQSDLESCGGCMVPLKGDASLTHGAVEGRDCTAIQGVSDVSCIRGQCQVKKCLDGYTVNRTGDSCTPIERKKTVFEIAEEVLAAQFGA